MKTLFIVLTLFSFLDASLLTFENTNIKLIFGFAYGITFASFLFYFAFYIFNKEKMYIYYAFSQLGILIILINNSFQDNNHDNVLFPFFFLVFLIFFNLFTRDFLHTKINTPIIDKVIFFSLFIFTIEFLVLELIDRYFDLSLEEFYDIYIDAYISTSLFLTFYLYAAVKSYFKGQKEAIFYLFAWAGVFISIFAFEYRDFLMEEYLINPMYIVHFSIPLESVLLAFALSYKMKLIINEKEEQKRIVIQQNKLASLGEMLANIAHQWRQPLTHLSYIMMNIEARYEKDKLSKEYINNKVKEANTQLEFMSDTINSFRDFFKEDKTKEEFFLAKAINDTINLLHGSFDEKDIKINFQYKGDISIYSYKKEFSQVVFNILNNAKDEFLRKKIKNPRVEISLVEDKNFYIISISDNAGGIDEKIIDKIFEPYFSTKEDSLGLGLYMSKMIIEKSFNTNLEVSNIQDGASFKIKLKK